MNLYVCIEDEGQDVKYFLSEDVFNISDFMDMSNYTITKLPKVMQLSLYKEQLIIC